MSKPRHATTSSHRLPTDCALALSEAELSAVLGGERPATPKEELFDQVLDTFNSVGEAVDPFWAPVRESLELLNAAGNYARWAVEHQQSRELSEERGRQLDAEQREAEEEKQREKEEDNHRLLQGDKPTSPQEVSDWLDIVATEPPYSGQSPYIPSNMTDAAPPPHTPRIILEPLDSTPYQHPG